MSHPTVHHGFHWLLVEFGLDIEFFCLILLLALCGFTLHESIKDLQYSNIWVVCLLQSIQLMFQGIIICIMFIGTNSTRNRLLLFRCVCLLGIVFTTLGCLHLSFVLHLPLPLSLLLTLGILMFLIHVLGSPQKSNILFATVIAAARVCTLCCHISLCIHDYRPFMKWKILSSYDMSLISNIRLEKSLIYAWILHVCCSVPIALIPICSAPFHYSGVPNPLSLTILYMKL